MYIPKSNNHSNPEEDFNAESAMASSMNWIWENFIGPNVDATDESQAEMLIIIGATLKVIADQASAYQKLQDLNQEEKNYFSRN